MFAVWVPTAGAGFQDALGKQKRENHRTRLCEGCIKTPQVCFSSRNHGTKKGSPAKQQEAHPARRHMELTRGGGASVLTSLGTTGVRMSDRKRWDGRDVWSHGCGRKDECQADLDREHGSFTSWLPVWPQTRNFHTRHRHGGWRLNSVMYT